MTNSARPPTFSCTGPAETHHGVRVQREVDFADPLPTLHIGRYEQR